MAYELLSGEKIKLKKLKKNEREHIQSLEKCVEECENHDNEDYFHIYRQAMVPIKEGKYFTAKTLQALHDSPYYKVVSDLVTRYWYKCFHEDENFEKHIRKGEDWEEYSRWKKTEV